MADEEQVQEAAGDGQGALNVVGLVLTIALAGGAGYLGAVVGAPPPPETKEEVVDMSGLPGPTIKLQSFVFTIPDSAGEAHAVKMTLAIELTKGSSEDKFNAFVPRVRDTLLEYLRNQTYERLIDSKRKQDMVQDMLESVKLFTGKGESPVVRVLIQDIIAQ